MPGSPSSVDSVDNVFRALADPTRRAIVSRLSRSQASVSELAEPLGITLAAVVQHVQLLEECGVISTHKAGRVRTCRIEPRSFSLVEEWLTRHRSMWEMHFDQLDAYLATPTPAKKPAPRRR